MTAGVSGVSTPSLREEIAAALRSEHLRRGGDPARYRAADAVLATLVEWYRDHRDEMVEAGATAMFGVQHSLGEVADLGRALDAVFSMMGDER